MLLGSDSPRGQRTKEIAMRRRTLLAGLGGLGLTGALGACSAVAASIETEEEDR